MTGSRAARVYASEKLNDHTGNHLKVGRGEATGKGVLYHEHYFWTAKEYVLISGLI